MMNTKLASLKLLTILTITIAIASCQAVRKNDSVSSPMFPKIPKYKISYEPAVGDTFKSGEEVRKIISYDSITGVQKPTELTNYGDVDKQLYKYGWIVNNTIFQGAVSTDPSLATLDVEKSGKGMSRALNWVVNCERDKITDDKSCILFRNNRKYVKIISIGYVGIKPASILCIGGDRYPGSEIQLRVDKNPGRAAPEKTCFKNDLENILEEIKSGKNVITRYQKWPRQTWNESEFDTYGFPLAVEFMYWMYDNF